MSGVAVEELVATRAGLVPRRHPGEAPGRDDLLELSFSDGSLVRCAPDDTFLTVDGRSVRADSIAPTDRIRPPVGYVPRSGCPAVLPEPALAVARRSTLPLSVIWDEDLAHYLGWLVGDGSFTYRGAVTIYGSGSDIREILPGHLDLLSRWTGFEPKPSIQASGTVQLRLMRRDFVDLLPALGVLPVKSAEKVIPRAILTAPEESVTALLRGLFDADGCVVNDTVKGTRYVGLGSRSEELLRGAQALLASLDI